MVISKVPGHSQLIHSQDPRYPLLPRFSTGISAPNEELPSGQHEGCLFPSSISRGLVHRGFFSPQGALGLVGQERSAQQDHVLKRLKLFALSTDKCHLSFETEIGYWSLWLVKAVEYFFQDGLAETWQTEMFS